jgi:hypothetical protein
LLVSNDADFHEPASTGQARCTNPMSIVPE